MKLSLVNGRIGIHLPVEVSQNNQLCIRKKGTNIPIWGQISNHHLVPIFYPRVPLSDSFIYEVFDKKSKKVISQFSIKIKKNKETTFVKAIYPQSSILPQNLLRFHIVFSRPMQKGQFEKKIQLANLTTGIEEENVFEKMRHEIWNIDGTRLTLYLDPGRIKSGLGLQEMLGMPLQKGHQYQLQISADWKDIYGKSIQENYSKTFTVKEIDQLIPDVKQIEITYEDGQIKLRFNESINHPQVAQVIFVKKNERVIKGKWHSENGQLYAFITNDFLEKGKYEILISSELEDLVGHSFRCSFESPVGTEYKTPYWIQKIVQVN